MNVKEILQEEGLLYHDATFPVVYCFGRFPKAGEGGVIVNGVGYFYGDCAECPVAQNVNLEDDDTPCLDCEEVDNG